MYLHWYTLGWLWICLYINTSTSTHHTYYIYIHVCIHTVHIRSISQHRFTYTDTRIWVYAQNHTNYTSVTHKKKHIHTYQLHIMHACIHMPQYFCIPVYLVPVEGMSKIFQWRFIVLDQKTFYKHVTWSSDHLECILLPIFRHIHIQKKHWWQGIQNATGVLKWGTPGYLSRSFKSMVMFIDVILIGKPVVIWASLPLFQQTSKWNVDRRSQCCRCSAQGTLGTTKPRLDQGWIDPHFPKMIWANHTEDHHWGSAYHIGFIGQRNKVANISSHQSADSLL